MICQAVTDAAQLGHEEPIDVARKLLRTGIKTAIITLARDGCLAMQGTEVWRIHAPQIETIDGCGAGATFSAGYIYAYLKAWSFLDSLRFATAAASLKVSRAGLEMFPVDQISAIAEGLRIEQLDPAKTDLRQDAMP